MVVARRCRPWGCEWEQAEEGGLREQDVALAAHVQSWQALWWGEPCHTPQRLVLAPPLRFP